MARKLEHTIAQVNSRPETGLLKKSISLGIDHRRHPGFRRNDEQNLIRP